MKPELICEWLGLPDGSWPCDHYRLLGLTPGEADAHLIEQRVQQRLESVRRYQMKHPEQATEAMNRLAQAYVCLTEPASKRAYDAGLLGIQAPMSAATAVAEPPPLTPAPDAMAWLFGPALTRSRSPSSTPPPQARLAPLAPPAKSPTPRPVEPASELIDPVVAAAQQSHAARRGLGTKRALYTRVVATRRFLSVWAELGKFLESPKRRVSRSADGPELNRLLEETVRLRRQFPRLIGAAGQPGYLIVIFSEQDDAAKSIRALDESQREALSRDWSAGRKLLTAHRDFLRQEIRAMRKRTFKERLVRAVHAVFTDQPTVTFLLLLLLAVNIALWRSYAWQLLEWFQGR